jgi:hypothetical protein
MMLFYSRDLVQAYKDFWTKNYVIFITSSILEVNLAKTKIMMFGRNKRKLYQEALCLDKDQIKITHEYKYLEIDFIHMVTISHLV